MKKYFHSLFDYNNWANTRIIEKLKFIENSEDKSLKLMSHIISAQDNWLEKIKRTKNYNIDIWEIYSVQELQILSDKSTKAWLKFISKLSNSEFEKICSYKTSKGTEYQNTYQEILAHVINHSTYHRGQINQLLRINSIEPVMTDYIYYSWNKNTK